jgi:hypothetical protein
VELNELRENEFNDLRQVYEESQLPVLVPVHVQDPLPVVDPLPARQKDLEEQFEHRVRKSALAATSVK